MGYHSTFGNDPYNATKLNATLAILVKASVAMDVYLLVRHGYLMITRHLHRQSERNLFLFIGRKAYHCHLTWIASEIFLQISHLATIIRDRSYGLVQIQRTMITCHFALTVQEMNLDVTERKMRSKALPMSTQVLISQLIALCQVTIQECLAHLLQFFRTTEIVGIRIFLTGPQGDLIERYRLRLTATIYHHTQSSISQRHGTHPFF